MFDSHTHRMSLKVILPFLIFHQVKCNHDFYLNQVRNECHTSQSTYTCAKYSVLNFLEEFHPPEYNVTIDGSLRILDIPPTNETTSGVRGLDEDADSSEFGKIVNYFQRRVKRLLGSHGISMELPEGARLLTDDHEEMAEARGKKKKIAILFPFLILLKLFKIKVLLTLTLMGVMFIKKTMLIAAFILPSVIAGLKAHCKATQYQVIPYHAEDDHFHHETEESGYGLGSLVGTADLKQHYWDKNARKQYVNNYGRTLGWL